MNDGEKEHLAHGLKEFFARGSGEGFWFDGRLAARI